MSFGRANARGLPKANPAPPKPTAPNAAKNASNAPTKVAFKDAAAAVMSRPKSGRQRGGAASDGSRIVDHYQVIANLHTSQAAGTELCVATHRMTGQKVVLKAFDRQRFSASGRVPIAHSTLLHARIEHEHICRLYEVFDSQRVVHVIEYVHGLALDEYMQTYGCGAEEARQILQQLVGAVASMHANGVCHRDLRLGNVMLKAGPKCCVKLIDLGALGPADKLVTRRTPVVPVFAAPELLTQNANAEYSGKAVDVWALGIMTYIMLTGTYPFTSEKAAKEGKVPTHEGIPAPIHELLTGMLQVDPDKRLTAAEVLKHPWLKPDTVEEKAPTQQIIASGSPAAWLRERRALAKTEASENNGGENENTSEASDEVAKVLEEVKPSNKVDAAAHEEVLKMLSELNVPRESVNASLASGSRDELTTAYCLLWQKIAARKEAEEAMAVGGGEEGEAPAEPEK